MQLVQRGPMGCLNAHDVPIIIQPGQGFPGHIPEGLFRLLLAQKTRATFDTIDPIHMESGPSQRIQFHRFRVDVAAVYPVFVCHVSAASFHVYDTRAATFCRLERLVGLEVTLRFDGTEEDCMAGCTMADQTAIQFLRFPAWEFIDSSRRLSDNTVITCRQFDYSNVRLVLPSFRKYISVSILETLFFIAAR